MEYSLSPFASGALSRAADYILYYKPNIPLALIEAKDNTHSVGEGIQQGLEYAAALVIAHVRLDKPGTAEPVDH